MGVPRASACPGRWDEGTIDNCVSALKSNKNPLKIVVFRKKIFDYLLSELTSERVKKHLKIELHSGKQLNLFIAQSEASPVGRGDLEKQLKKPGQAHVPMTSAGHALTEAWPQDQSRHRS